jgi:hypothetical protein
MSAAKCRRLHTGRRHARTLRADSGICVRLRRGQGPRLDGDRVVESDLRDVETVGVTQIVGQEARLGHLGCVGVLANVTLYDKPTTQFLRQLLRRSPSDNPGCIGSSLSEVASLHVENYIRVTTRWVDFAEIGAYAGEACSSDKGEIELVRRRPCSGEQRLELEMGQSEGRGLRRHAGAPHVLSWGMLEDVVDDACAVEEATTDMRRDTVEALIRELVINPERDYQPQGAKQGSPTNPERA